MYTVNDKTNLGMKFHTDAQGRYLPIIVQGDPRKPRGKPRVSLGDIDIKSREGQLHIVFSRKLV